MELIAEMMSWYTEISTEALIALFVVHGRVTVLLLCCMLLLRYLNYRQGSAAHHHIVVIIDLLSTLLLPLSSYIMPAYDIVIEVTRPIVSESFPSALGDVLRNSITENHQLVSISSSLLVAYACIMLIILTSVFISNLKIYVLSARCDHVKQVYWKQSLRACARDLAVDGNILIKHSRLISSPMTWGVFKPVILIPTNAFHWPDQLIQSTLLHELAHIKRRDWLSQQFARCVCAVYWINPLCWRALNQLNNFAETASDDIALTSGQDSTHYARSLVNVATHLNQKQTYTLAAMSMANNKKASQLKLRVQSVLTPGEQHRPLTATQAALALCFVVLVLVPVTSLKANIIEKVNFVITYNDDKKESPNTDVDVELAEVPLNVNDTEMIALEDIKSMVFDESSTPPSRAISPEIPVLKEAVVKTEMNQLSANDIVERAKLKLAQSLPKTEKLAVKTQNKSSEKIIHNEPAITTHVESTKENNVVEEKPIIVQHVVKRLEIPKYPTRAQKRGIEGEVTVEYNLDRHGNVTHARIVKASPERVFNKTVLRALNKSEFSPKKIDGKAVGTTGLREKYVFVLKS